MRWVTRKGEHGEESTLQQNFFAGKRRISGLMLRGGATATQPLAETNEHKEEKKASRNLFWLPCHKAKDPPDTWWPKTLGEKGELLGVGRFSEVFHSVNLENGMHVAVKIMRVLGMDYCDVLEKVQLHGHEANPLCECTLIRDPSFVGKDHVFANFTVKARPSDLVLHKRINREIEILKEVGDHPGIVKLFDVFRSEDRVGLIFERCYGGELFNILENTSISSKGERVFTNRTKGAKYKTIELTEKCIATILGQVLDVVKYLHERGIVHRDLKLENVLLEQPFGTKEGGALSSKLIDFGLSKRLKDEGGMFAACGSAYYAAPEVMNAVKSGKPYGAPCDLWALGVMGFCLLCRQYPFDGETTKEILAAVQKADFEFPPSIVVSDDAKDFVTKCLTLDPEKRLTVHGALEHKWIKTLRIKDF